MSHDNRSKTSPGRKTKLPADVKSKPKTKSKAAKPSASKKAPTAYVPEAQTLLLVKNAQKIDLIHEQISLVHGVLEELCERHEAMSMWHIEFANRVLKFLDPRLKNLPKDQFKEATEFLEELNLDLHARRDIREEFFKNSDAFDEMLTGDYNLAEETLENNTVIPESNKRIIH